MNSATPQASPQHATRGAAGRVSRRYAIWGLQQAAGHEPCFGTARRYTCDETGCTFRRECLQLRANWRL